MAILAEADSGLTAMAMEGQKGRYNGDEFLLVKFFTHPKLNRVKSKEEQRPIYVETPYIQIMQPGNKDSIVIRPATAMDKNRFAEHFRKYEARETEEHVEGTLLEEWTGITRSQCEELKYLNIRTVEQLAGVNDSNAQNVMGIAFLKQKAGKYLIAAKDEATSQALMETKEELATLKAQMAALMDSHVPDAALEVVKTPKKRAKPKAKRAKKAK